VQLVSLLTHSACFIATERDTDFVSRYDNESKEISYLPNLGKNIHQGVFIAQTYNVRKLKSWTEVRKKLI